MNSYEIKICSEATIIWSLSPLNNNKDFYSAISVGSWRYINYINNETQLYKKYGLKNYYLKIKIKIKSED